MPATRALRRLVPYLRPYVTQLTVGLVFVVVSAAFGRRARAASLQRFLALTAPVSLVPIRSIRSCWKPT